MHLAALKLNQFRNYVNQEISFHPRINVFAGLNAQGKTNLLEAIYYLAVSRSFRTTQESDLPRFGSDFFRLQGQFQREGERWGIALDYRLAHPLRIRVNGKTFRRMEYIHRHPIVVFSPDDLLLIKEGPSLRRRFLDTEGSRLKPLYYRRWRDYHRVLQQRNRILKERRGSRSFDNALLEPWNRSLIGYGSEIIRDRINLLAALEGRASAHFGTLTAGRESLSLHYRSTIDYGGDADLVESAFRDQLSESRPAEQRRGSTVVGPHLDDFSVLINGHDARKYGSQGQQRSAVLALKIGEVGLFERAGGDETMLLLDDVLSEFDEMRSGYLLYYLEGRAGQSFITTAAPLPTAGCFSTGLARSFSIDGGKVRIDRAGADY